MFSFLLWKNLRMGNVCLLNEMALRTENLDKAIAEVIGTFDGVLEISAEQREGIANYVLAVLPTSHGKLLLFELLPGIWRVLNTMECTSYPKKLLF